MLNTEGNRIQVLTVEKVLAGQRFHTPSLAGLERASLGRASLIYRVMGKTNFYVNPASQGGTERTEIQRMGGVTILRIGWLAPLESTTTNPGDNHPEDGWQSNALSGSH